MGEGKVYFMNLYERVKAESNSKVNFYKEWKIIHTHELSKDKKEKCLCGKINTKFVFTIKNKVNSKELRPIGSACINQFGRKVFCVVCGTRVKESYYHIKHLNSRKHKRNANKNLSRPELGRNKRRRRN